MLRLSLYCLCWLLLEGIGDIKDLRKEVGVARKLNLCWLVGWIGEGDSQ